MGLAALAGVVVNMLDYEEGIEGAGRRRWYRRLQVFTVLMVAASFLAAIWAKIDNDKDAAHLLSKVDSAEQHARKGEEAGREANEQLAQARHSAEDFRLRLERLQRSIEPIVAWVKQAHPGISDEDALVQVREELRALQQRTQHVEEQATELRERTAPRSITPDQARKITAALRGVKGTVRFRLPADDPEVEDYFRQLDAAVRGAGWTVPHEIRQFGDTNPRGLFLAVHDWDHVPPMAQLLGDALIDAGVKIELINKANLPDGAIEFEIFVGHRRVQ